MVRMEIYGVSFDLVGKTPIVLLKMVEGNKFLPIWIGHPEAAAILMKLQETPAPRPMTHDLVADIVQQLGGEVVSITVTELRDSTFYASITVRQNGGEIEIDSRPSDAIAIAMRVDAEIYVADEVMAESAVEFEGEDVSEEEMVDQFRQFLETVSPEEFALGDEGDEGEEGEEGN
jgi:bifunctional DNase/RNase